MRASGYTLAEILVSLTILAIISVGIGSSMLIAGRAMPDADAPQQAVMSSTLGSERLCNDLPYAIQINSASTTGISFTVADRDGDTFVESLNYNWSGTAGDSLYLNINSLDPLVILPEVHSFNLSYTTEKNTTETPNSNESNETLLIYHNTSSNYRARDITSSTWYGQYFKPTLPADAVSWSIHRVEFYAKSYGALNGQCKIQLQPASIGGWPSGVVYEEETLLESSLLDTYVLQSFNFTAVEDLPPDQGVCMIIENVTTVPAGTLLTHDAASGLSHIDLLRTSNSGGSWTKPSNEALLFWVFGTVTTEATPTVETVQYLQAVRLELNTTEASETLIQTTVSILNQPEISL